jgi:hypothetical protein
MMFPNIKKSSLYEKWSKSLWSNFIVANVLTISVKVVYQLEMHAPNKVLFCYSELLKPIGIIYIYQY